MTVNWPRFAEIIRAHERFLLTSHIRPDCDALGSELGMALILEALGKRVTIVNGMETPPNLAFIDPDNRIKVIGETIQMEDLDDIEVLMVLDTSAWAQLGPMGDVLRATKAKKIVVDHHVSEDDLDTEAFKNTTAEATGRLVVEAAEELGVELTADMAMPIYAALATDTGWFRFGSVTSGTYRIAAKLLDAGASPPAIYRDLYEQDTVGRVKLRGVILSRTVTELDGRLAHTYVLKEDFETTGALPADTEDAINMTLAIAGVQFAVIAVEQATGGFKLSFRSRCELQCNKIAEQFNGGGHKAAAGAFIAGSFEEAQPKVLDVVRAAMR
ncbi:MAG: bifunctional oligoribonuclease/PAP phosphatase NrnA [Planctomycetaceae bacterium]|nr:bifunctional oligoribonuclease/PAP phosphatase NrnA [Planctomycetales bacterium]MCB9873095.1 bifunctional oligoribonuclease/PAP phosphatase NrnA [Planctomycetaceae bacterium]MCB9937775.1 bifunctional oligoribonuclease/PAP phosphatase NrnA [Planctomycetaceae bacterium]HRX80563.1 bifunctional oligoribonuclease/PAP phosphatase NrnA [Pirellulaceae bacterium]